MLRCAVFRAAAPAVRSAGVRASPARCLSTSARALAEGDTGSGASRAGGVREGDAFAKREHAAEEMYIMQEERQKLMALRQKLKAQRQHMDELEKHIDDMVKESGGEQH